LEISVEKKGSTLVVNVSGRVTMQTAHQLQQSIKETLKSDLDRIIVNLADVAYMDSSGVGVLVSGSKMARDRAIPLGLSGIVERVMLVMKMTGLETIFRIFPDVPTALDELA